MLALLVQQNRVVAVHSPVHTGNPFDLPDDVEVVFGKVYIKAVKSVFFVLLHVVNEM